jgi:MoaA/NifB/PqqE/SkfB family radical SAM enzyme
LSYKQLKRETLDSFVAFAQGGPDPLWPAEVFLEVSNLCDLKCAMCGVFSRLNPNRFTILRQEDRGFMDSTQFDNSLDEILKRAINVHLFGYGEPTLHPDFESFVTRMNEYEAMVDFFTNGMSLDQSMCEMLVKNRVHKITVSFSGSNAQEYDNVYLGGDFHQVMDGMARLQQVKKESGSRYPLVEINSLAFNHQVEKLNEFIELMSDKDIHRIFLKPVHGHEDIPELHGHIAFYRPDVDAAIISSAKATARRYGIDLNTTEFERMPVPSDSSLDEMRNNQIIAKDTSTDDRTIPIAQLKDATLGVERIRPSGPRKMERAVRAVDDLGLAPSVPAPAQPCMEPFKTLYVHQDGNIRPCCFGDSNFSLGSLDDSEATHLWNGENYQAIRRGILENSYPKDLCGNCLKLEMGPSDHGIPSLFRDYLNWSGERFASSWLQRLSTRLKYYLLPSNDLIVARHDDQSSTITREISVFSYYAKQAKRVFDSKTIGRR